MTLVAAYRTLGVPVLLGDFLITAEPQQLYDAHVAGARNSLPHSGPTPPGGAQPRRSSACRGSRRAPREKDAALTDEVLKELYRSRRRRV